MYAEELLCRHCGFVFWVEETLASHCQQFHKEEEKMLEEEKNRLVEEEGKELVLNRKRKRKFRKAPSARVIKTTNQCPVADLKFNEEVVMEDIEDEQDDAKNIGISTEINKSKKLSIIQQMVNSNDSDSLQKTLPPEVFKCLPKTTKISLVTATYDDKQVQELPERKMVTMSRLAKQKCTSCSLEFTSKTRLEEHIAASHIFKCGHCKKTFQSVEDLKTHLQKSHYLMCEFCSSKFANADDKADHMVYVHVRCNICDITFTRSSDIEEHVEKNHQSCDICEDFFNWAEPSHRCFYTRSNSRPIVYSSI